MLCVRYFSVYAVYVSNLKVTSFYINMLRFLTHLLFFSVNPRPHNHILCTSFLQNQHILCTSYSKNLTSNFYLLTFNFQLLTFNF